MTLALIPISTYSATAAGPQTPSCGNYKVTTNQYFWYFLYKSDGKQGHICPVSEIKR